MEIAVLVVEMIDAVTGATIRDTRGIREVTDTMLHAASIMEIDQALVLLDALFLHHLQGFRSLLHHHDARR
jgi:hypothetical protein